MVAILNFANKKKLLNDDRVSSIGFMISGFSSTRINNKTLYVLQNPLQPAATRLLEVKSQKGSSNHFREDGMLTFVTMLTINFDLCCIHFCRMTPKFVIYDLVMAV